jgi:hypothetical protein
MSNFSDIHYWLGFCGRARPSCITDSISTREVQIRISYGKLLQQQLLAT